MGIIGQGGKAGQDYKSAKRGKGDGSKWKRTRCPTCRGKGTKGFDRNGPKKCPLCGGDKVILVPQEK